MCYLDSWKTDKVNDAGDDVWVRFCLTEYLPPEGLADRDLGHRHIGRPIQRSHDVGLLQWPLVGNSGWI